MRKKKFCILILMVALLLSGCGSSFQMTLSDPSLLKVGSVSIGDKEARLLLMNLKCSYESQYIESYGEDFWDNEMESNYSYEKYFLENDFLHELCSLLYACGEAEKADLSLSAEEKDKLELAAEEYYEDLSAEEKEYTNASVSDVKALYEHYLLAEKWIAAVTKDIPTEISEEEARIMQLKQIYVTDAATAEEVWNQAVLGANFDSLAAIYNKSEEYICYVSRNDRSAKVAKALFAMKNGEISDILEENGGYYIMMCVNSYEKERTQENKEMVYRQSVYECWHELYTKNIKNEKISRNNRLWNRMDLSYNENISNHSLFEVYDKYFYE